MQLVVALIKHHTRQRIITACVHVYLDHSYTMPQLLVGEAMCHICPRLLAYRVHSLGLLSKGAYKYALKFMVSTMERGAMNGRPRSVSIVGS